MCIRDRRLADHKRGVDSATVKPWFAMNADNLLCYVIEWVDEDMRLQAESYWYLTLGGESLVNSVWREARTHAIGYTTDACFDPATAKGFTTADGQQWPTVERRAYATLEQSTWDAEPFGCRLLIQLSRRLDKANRQRDRFQATSIPTDCVDSDALMHELAVVVAMEKYSITRPQLDAILAGKVGQQC